MANPCKRKEKPTQTIRRRFQIPDSFEKASKRDSKLVEMIEIQADDQQLDFSAA
jgi:hypothetical protein